MDVETGSENCIQLPSLVNEESKKPSLDRNGCRLSTVLRKSLWSVVQESAVRQAHYFREPPTLSFLPPLTFSERNCTALVPLRTHSSIHPALTSLLEFGTSRSRSLCVCCKKRNSRSLFAREQSDRQAAMLSTMRFIFERTKTPLEVMRENRRLMERGMREIEREKQSLHAIEMRLIQEIRKAAKLNQWDAVKIMTIDLIRTRHRIIRCYSLNQQLKSISVHNQTLKSTEAMAEALQGFIKVVRQLNLHVSQPALQKIIQEFEVHHAQMDMSLEEMESEDDYFSQEAEDELEVDENDEVVLQVLDEIGVDNTPV